EGKGSAEAVQERVGRIQQLKDALREEAEGPQRELQVLSGQRRVLVLQMEALRVEAQQTERDLQDQHQRHQTELRRLRDESLQVFRAFRQVSEEQRKLSEGRYRSVLLEAVQDAVYLSAQNQQLQADNKRL
uniref:Si:dkey-201i24.3 n=1 Tax=Kryptolebias marmoratus TaxID=37003 RepID=A0A3Q2ZP77_KRYMA